MGELNFCLGPSDSVLSGPSLLKDLNTATNKMVKNLLILNSPGQSVSQSAGQPASRSLKVDPTQARARRDYLQHSRTTLVLSCCVHAALHHNQLSSELSGILWSIRNLAFPRTPSGK